MSFSLGFLPSTLFLSYSSGFVLERVPASHVMSNAPFAKLEMLTAEPA